MQNSEIHVESTVGEGTCFYFTLNFEIGSDKALKREKEADEIKDYQSLEGYKVLLVEDNKMNVFIAQQFLEGWGLEVTVKYNGKTAVQELLTNKHDLVLMDLEMPEMDGYEATRAIREYEKFKSLPIIALTASALFEVEKQVLEAGMNDYITKPFNPNELYQKIVDYLGVQYA